MGCDPSGQSVQNSSMEEDGTGGDTGESELDSTEEDGAGGDNGESMDRMEEDEAEGETGENSTEMEGETDMNQVIFMSLFNTI